MEFDSPYILLCDSQSQFASLVEQAGVAEAGYLRSLASIASSKAKSNVSKINENNDDDSVQHNGETDPLIG